MSKHIEEHSSISTFGPMLLKNSRGAFFFFEHLYTGLFFYISRTIFRGHSYLLISYILNSFNNSSSIKNINNLVFEHAFYLNVFFLVFFSIVALSISTYIHGHTTLRNSTHFSFGTGDYSLDYISTMGNVVVIGLSCIFELKSMRY